MDIFKEVKERVDILKVCDILGLKLDRNYKTLCPFHKEKTPSFSVLPSKNIFCCFGCDVKGDAITLVEKILNISPLEAAKYINSHLGLGVDVDSKQPSWEINHSVNRYSQKRKIQNKVIQWKYTTLQNLCDYLHLLKKWKRLKDIDDKRYIEALQQIDIIEYYIDFLIDATYDDTIWFKEINGKVGEQIGRRIGR